MSKHLSQAIRGQESTRLGNSLETSLAAGMGSNTDAAQSKVSKLNSDPSKWFTIVLISPQVEQCSSAEGYNRY